MPLRMNWFVGACMTLESFLYMIHKRSKELSILEMFSIEQFAPAYGTWDSCTWALTSSVETARLLPTSLYELNYYILLYWRRFTPWPHM